MLGLNRDGIVSSFLHGEAIVADGPVLPGPGRTMMGWSISITTLKAPSVC